MGPLDPKLSYRLNVGRLENLRYLLQPDCEHRPAPPAVLDRLTRRRTQGNNPHIDRRLRASQEFEIPAAALRTVASVDAGRAFGVLPGMERHAGHSSS